MQMQRGRNLVEVMGRRGGNDGGGDVDPPPPPPPPPDPIPEMPTTAPSGFSRQADTEFLLNVAEGDFAKTTSGYWGNPSADDRGRMQFSAYTYPAYTDTRSKHTCPFKNPDGTPGTPMMISTTAGSPNITWVSGPNFTAANYCYAGLAGAGASPFGGSYIELYNATANQQKVAGSSTLFDFPTRFLTVNSTTSATLTKPAKQTGTFRVITRADFGYYNPARYSVQNGILRLHVGTDNAGRHMVGALRPKLDNALGGSKWDVFGGGFEYAMRVPTEIPTYKMAPELWPKSDSSKNGGEIDFPETDLLLSDSATAFTHYQDNSSQYQNSSTTKVVGSAWHRYRIEWRPNANFSLTTVKYFIDGVQVGVTRSGVNVPHDPMHWIWQVEADLKYSSQIDDLSDGYVEYAWALFDKMV